MSKKPASGTTFRRGSPQPYHHPDHIDYTEHILRRTVQRTPLRNNLTTTSPHVKHDFFSFKDNLSLYLHKKTAILKSQQSITSTSSRPLRNLFLANPDGQHNRVLPKVFGYHTNRVLENGKDLKIPTDRLNRKILQQIEDEKPIDFFVYESRGETEKKSNNRQKSPPKSVSPEQRLEQLIAQNLNDEQLDKCFQQYCQSKTARNMRKLMIYEENNINFDEPFIDQSTFSYKNPLALKFFLTDQGNALSEVPEGEKGSKEEVIHEKFLKNVQKDDIKLINKVCRENNLQIGQLFSMEEKEFRMKYQNLDPRSQNVRYRKANSVARSLSEKKMRFFETEPAEEILKGLTHEEVGLRKLLNDDEISKNRQKDLIHSNITMNKNMGKVPSGSASIRPQIIMQTKYNRATVEPGSAKMQILKVTTLTNASKESSGKEIKKLSRSATERVSFTEWANKTVRAAELADQEPGEERPRAESQGRRSIQPFRLNLVEKDISNFQGVSEKQGITTRRTGRTTPSTDVRSSRVYQPTISLDVQNSKSSMELKQVFNNFCDDVRNVQEHNQELNENIKSQIHQLESKVEKEYQELENFDKKIMKFVLPKSFRKMEKRSNFKKVLVACLTDRISDKKGLLEDYEKKKRENKILDMHQLTTDYALKPDQSK